jgi:hypothetical protein
MSWNFSKLTVKLLTTVSISRYYTAKLALAYGLVQLLIYIADSRAKLMDRYKN